jgi:hypothetical protein
MELLLYLPSRANGPVPLFLGLNFNGNFATTDETDLPLPSHYVQGLGITPNNHRATESMRGHDKSMWPYDAILDRGYGIATACYCEAEPDLPNQWWHGPRVLLILSAVDDHWSDPQGEFLSAVAATPVYNLLGADGLSTQNFPPPPTLFNSTLGYFIRPGGHNVTLDDWHATLDWSDRHLK